MLLFDHRYQPTDISPFLVYTPFRYQHLFDSMVHLEYLNPLDNCRFPQFHLLNLFWYHLRIFRNNYPLLMYHIVFPIQPHFVLSYVMINRFQHFLLSIPKLLKIMEHPLLWCQYHLPEFLFLLNPFHYHRQFLLILRLVYFLYIPCTFVQWFPLLNMRCQFLVVFVIHLI